MTFGSHALFFFLPSGSLQNGGSVYSGYIFGSALRGSATLNNFYSARLPSTFRKQLKAPNCQRMRCWTALAFVVVVATFVAAYKQHESGVVEDTLQDPLAFQQSFQKLQPVSLDAAKEHNNMV